MNIKSIAFGLAASALLAGCGGGGSSPTKNLPPPGPVTVLTTAVIGGAPAFVNAAQHAVYTFDGDTTPNQSNCTGGCLAVWPAVAPPSVTISSPWAAFMRSGGSQQLSYNGKPLYTFTGDTAPDVATGDNVNGFHVARPASGSGNGVPPGNPGYHP